MYLDGFESDRINFRALSESDIDVWTEFMRSREAIRYLPRTDFTPEEHSTFWIGKQLNRYRENRLGLHALIHKETGDFLGQAGLLTQTVDGQDVIEIGYHLFPKHWGHGYATEAAQFCKQFAWDNNIAEDLVSIIDKSNTPSQKVAERNGMERLRETRYYNLDVYIYGISKPS